MRAVLLLALLAASSAISHAGITATPLDADGLEEASWNASVTVDFSLKNPVAPTLYGIFFEEVRPTFPRVKQGLKDRVRSPKSIIDIRDQVGHT
jgi:hypothetical protein